MANPKKVSPSRIRYEKNNPVIAIRVSREFYEEITALKHKADMSLGDLVKIGMDKTEPQVGGAYLNGFQAALAEAYLKVCEDCQNILFDLGDEFPSKA